MIEAAPTFQIGFFFFLHVQNFFFYILRFFLPGHELRIMWFKTATKPIYLIRR